MSKEIEIAAKMYRARRACITLVGEDRLRKEAAEFEPTFRACAKNKGLSEVDTTIHFMKDVQSALPGNGYAQLLILASCVEIMEPSL